MMMLFYSEDRELCTYPKGYRFEWCQLLIDKEKLEFWINGKGYYGCLTKIKISDDQAFTWLLMYEKQTKLWKEH